MITICLLNRQTEIVEVHYILTLSRSRRVDYNELFRGFLVYFQNQAFAAKDWKIEPSDVDKTSVCIKIYPQTYVIDTTLETPASKVTFNSSSSSKTQLGSQKSLSDQPHASSSRNTDNRGNDTNQRKELLEALKKYV